MAEDLTPDFGGYATKAGLKCADGRVITPEAFQHMHGRKVPLVWMHGHSEPGNVLGHALLEARSDGVYAYGFFNQSVAAQHSNLAIKNGDLDSLSIYANQLKEHKLVVSHGNIKEVSIVLAGANPGAKIDQIKLQHSDDPDDVEVLEEEAIIKHMGPLEFLQPDEDETDDEDDVAQHAAEGTSKTIKDVYETFNEEQMNVVHYMVGAALEEGSDDEDAAEHADNNEGALAHEEGNTTMGGRNVFDQNKQDSVSNGEGQSLSHDDMKGIIKDAVSRNSLKDALESYALQHGIESIETLFPDAKTITDTPEFNSRRMEWVSSVIDGTRHTPFSRVKTLVADLTFDDARAKGYVKGAYKKEEWFGVTKRTTTPTTVYKKQKLDRDDILDITDFNVIAWLKAEMRLMLEEEIARAILLGDGRDVSDEDKIKDPAGASDGAGIRAIVNDNELYVTTLQTNLLDANSSYEEVVDLVMDGMEYYKGTGTPTFFTTMKHLNGFLKAKNANGDRYYRTRQEVAAALGVDRVVTVEAMNDTPDLVGVVVNLSDYNIGTDRGGEINLFDDFDINYNQFLYLMETRLSGALVKIKSALVIRRTAVGAALVNPTKPTFVAATGVITIPSDTNVVYKDEAGSTLSAGAQTALAAGTSKRIIGTPATGKYFANSAERSWAFKRPHA